MESPITGKEMSAILNMNGNGNGKKNPFKEDVYGNGNGTLKKVREILKRSKNGENFWEIVWRPFIDRDLDRNTVKRILKTFYAESSHSFKKMTGCLNVDESDYKTFMSLLYKYRIDPRK